MKNLDVLTTLFVGIDVSSKTNVVYAMGFHFNKLLSVSVPNNQSGAETLVVKIHSLMEGSKFKAVCYAMESTSFYGIHIANYLSSNIKSLECSPYMYCLNPKVISNYRKSFIGMDKTDFKDAFVIADFARAGRITTSPWCGSQFLAFQRLTRHRLHFVKQMTQEKPIWFLISSSSSAKCLFLKDKIIHFPVITRQPLRLVYRVFSLQKIIDIPEKELVDFLRKKSRNRFKDPHDVASVLKKATRDSYRLDKTLCEPLNLAIASSFNCISSFKKEIHAIDKAIEKM